MLAGSGKTPAPVAQPVAAEPAARDAQRAAFAEKMGIAIKSKFDIGKGVELVSYTAKGGAEGGVFYHLADGTFVAGQMFDQTGTLQTDKHFKQAWPDGPPTPESTADLAGAMKLLDEAATATVAKGGPEIYMLYEPHCGFCQKSFTDIQKLNVTVHYLPVTFLSQESEALAAAMLSGDPGVMDKINDPKYRAELIAKYQEKADEIRPLVEKNAQVMRLAGIRGTPAFLWKGKDGVGGVQRGYLDLEGLKAMVAQVAVDQDAKVADSGTAAAN